MPSSSDDTRDRISSAALLVNVTARIDDGGTCFAVIRCAIRCVITRVLPLPAPARINTGPSVVSAASRCWGLRPERKSTCLPFSHRCNAHPRAAMVYIGRTGMNDLCFLTATEMARLVRAKKLSARELLDAHLQQIERVNPKVNAIVTCIPEEA